LVLDIENGQAVDPMSSQKPEKRREALPGASNKRRGKLFPSKTNQRQNKRVDVTFQKRERQPTGKETFSKKYSVTGCIGGSLVRLVRYGRMSFNGGRRCLVKKRRALLKPCIRRKGRRGQEIKNGNTAGPLLGRVYLSQTTKEMRSNEVIGYLLPWT